MKNDISKSEELENQILELKKRNHILEQKLIAKWSDISIKNESDALIEKNQTFFETFFNSIPDFLFVLDEQACIINCNATVIHRLGYTLEELTGKSVLMIHPAERRDEAGRIVGEMLCGKADFCPVPIITKSGIQIPVETRISHGIWNDKPVIFGVSKDISRLVISEEKFSKVFYLNPSACGLSDLENQQYVEVNEAFYALFGFNKNEVIGKTAMELNLFSQEARMALLQKTNSNGNIINAEAGLKAKNGDIKQVLLSSENIYVQDKKYRFTVVHDITERKQAEEKLRLINEKYSVLFNQSPIAIEFYDAQGGLIIVNEACLELFGVVDKNEISGFKLFEDPNITGERKAELLMNRSVRFESEFNFEVVKRLKLYQTTCTGIKNLLWSITPLIVDGLLIGYVEQIQDITERKQAEKSLKHSEGRQRILLDNIQTQIWYLTDETTYGTINKAHADFNGFKSEDMAFRNLYDIFPKENADTCRQSNTEVFSTKKIVRTEEWMSHVSGEQRLISITKTPKLRDDGTVEYVVCSAEDITNRKQHEKELKIANEKIEESEEKHRTVADYTYAWEYWIDINGDFVYISPSCKRITGYKPEDFLNNKELMHEIIYPDDVSIFQNYEHEIDENAERNQTEFRIITKQKEIRWIGHVCQDIIATNGKLLGVRGSNRDITDQKKAEQALMKSETELREANAAKDKLFSIIAHDLRSPFNGILGFSELLIESVNEFEIAETEKYLGIINSTAKNTLVLLDNLLNWTKSQTGQINFKPEKVVLSSVIQEIFELSNSSAKNKNIALNHFQSEEVKVFADPNMIKTILRNLISNAIKFTNSNGKINVYALQKDNFIEIAVSDNGIGMKDETRKKLFDVSSNITFPGTANEKGSGLGLVLCKEFVEKHGGKIWLESELGKGSVFKFNLPVSKSKSTIFTP